MNPPIKINLNEALKLIPDDVEAEGRCAYSAPCVIGMMMSEADRKRLVNAELDSSPIYSLMQSDIVDAPEDQEGELRQLQRLFDRKQTEDLRSMVKVLKEKYDVQAP